MNLRPLGPQETLGIVSHSMKCRVSQCFIGSSGCLVKYQFHSLCITKGWKTGHFVENASILPRNDFRLSFDSRRLRSPRPLSLQTGYAQYLARVPVENSQLKGEPLKQPPPTSRSVPSTVQEPSNGGSAQTKRRPSNPHTAIRPAAAPSSPPLPAGPADSPICSGCVSRSLVSLPEPRRGDSSRWSRSCEPS